MPFFAKSNGDWVRSIPELHGDRLYVAGMREEFNNSAVLEHRRASFRHVRPEVKPLANSNHFSPLPQIK